jgi:predicted adenylyl cyclase CyaB
MIHYDANHSQPMRNIELKARLADLVAARQIAQRLATKRLGTQHQVDTYFHCRAGRLKLREIDGLSSQLVWYARPDEQGPKASDYRLVPVSNPKTLKGALEAALGVRGVVEKRREVFLYHNVRIHLDEVTHLGQFLEFEAVLGPQVDDQTGHAQLDELTREFAIQPADLLSGSYGEMILDAAGQGPGGSEPAEEDRS